MTLRRSGRQLTQLVAVIASLTLGFHLLGSNPVFTFEWSLRWLDRADPEIALAALLRVTGLVFCYWMLITTTLYALSRSSGRVPRPIRWVTIPPIRRIVDRTLAATLAISSLAMPAHPLTAAAEPEPAIVLEIHGDGIPVPHLRLERSVAKAAPAESVPGANALARPLPLLPTAVATARTAVQAPAALPGGDLYTVVPGDNLWLIAETRIQDASEGAATEEMIATYWRKLIDDNTASLRSGDPNLIYAGEILTLPSLQVQP